MSYFTWGGKQFGDNIVNVRRHDITARFSPRRRKLSRIETLLLEFQFQGTQQQILDQVVEARTLFSADYQDARFFLDGGVATTHNLTNSADCISGVKVLNTPFPLGDGDQLATRRNYNVVLQAEYVGDGESDLVYWKERISYIGNGGPTFFVEDTFLGPQDAFTSQASSIQVIQRGQAIGFLEPVEPPAPVFPARVHNETVNTDWESGDCQGLGFAFFPTYWTYHMTLLSPAFALPWTR